MVVSALLMVVCDVYLVGTSHVSACDVDLLPIVDGFEKDSCHGSSDDFLLRFRYQTGAVVVQLRGLKFLNRNASADGNVRESGDVGGGLGKSYLFCLTVRWN
ncbi:hypothetical protein CASFOL_017147 [Castilleja foliolosa]|uniref:Secreted protein n=1 Tax=Castilleja foliolosa TaxID=1961234 RepID=A0ABD3DA79_9LAMI